LFCGLTGVVGYTMGGSPSLLTLITFIGGDDPMHGVIFGAIGAVICLVLSFVISFILFKDENTEEEQEEPVTIQEEAVRPLVNKVILSAPLTGEVVSLSEVPDEVFASGALGEGVAIIPTEGKVVAPCDGIVSAVMDTRHAIGLTAKNGMELLIHVGLNTVELNGKFYEYKVASGASVKKGDVLIEFDMEGIKEAGYQLHTPVLVTNSDQYVSIKTTAGSSVKAGEDLLSIV